MMQPLRVEARLARAIVNPGRPIALDALLTYAEAMQRDMQAPHRPEDVERIDIPIKRSACDRYWLASFSEQVVEDRARAHIVRRPLVTEMIDLGDESIKTVNIGAGANKGYRIPIEIGHLIDDRMTWWCIGDADCIRDLVGSIHYLSKRRAVGRGKIKSWSVEPCETWGEGFPVMRDGAALRNLPVDYEGVTEERRAFEALDPPYWMRARAEEVYAP